MSRSSIPQALREAVFRRDAGRCQYCHLAQLGHGATFHVDHIVPRSRGGPTSLDNLALQCRNCSLRKANKTTAIDPQNGQPTPEEIKAAVASAEPETARVWSADGSGQRVVLRGHEGGVMSAAFSPDGTRIVTASQDKTVRVWNADSSGPPLVLRGHETWAVAAAWSPDGTSIITASADGTMRVFRIDNLSAPILLRGHESLITAVAFSADNQRIVTASMDKTARVWNADGSGQPVVLRGHERIRSRGYGAYTMNLVDAARRHLDAANCLVDCEPPCRRRDVAGYLYGIAAECALKELMRRSHNWRQVERNDDPFFAHFPHLKSMLRDSVQGRHAGVLRRFAEDDAFMNEWDIMMRYAPRADISDRGSKAGERTPRMPSMRWRAADVRRLSLR